MNEIEKQIESLKRIIKAISENETIKSSPEYQKLLDHYLDELNKLLKELE